MATPSDPKNKKNVKTVLSKTCFQNAQKCVFLGVIYKISRGHAPDPPIMVVPSAPARKFSAYGYCQQSPLWKVSQTLLFSLQP